MTEHNIQDQAVWSSGSLGSSFSTFYYVLYLYLWLYLEGAKDLSKILGC